MIIEKKKVKGGQGEDSFSHADTIVDCCLISLYLIVETERREQSCLHLFYPQIKLLRCLSFAFLFLLVFFWLGGGG